MNLLCSFYSRVWIHGWFIRSVMAYISSITQVGVPHGSIFGPSYLLKQRATKPTYNSMLNSECQHTYLDYRIKLLNSCVLHDFCHLDEKLDRIISNDDNSAKH